MYLKKRPRHSGEGNLGMMPGQRSMGPPSFNAIPQPVEIDLTRQSGPYPPWGTTVYPLVPLEEPNSPFSSSGSSNKSAQLPIDYGNRVAVDPLENWYATNDGPWLPRGAVPEASHEDRPHLRGQPTGFRPNVYGSHTGNHQRPGYPLESGSVHYGVPPPSDSGYETRRSLENASVRSYDMVNPSLDSRSLTDRNVDVQPYGDSGLLREQLNSNGWAAAQVGTELSEFYRLRCDTCQKIVKTKSELKKHTLRHTKPFHCTVEDCPRNEGYSTTNDLDRHVKSKHPNMFPGGRPPKTYRCLEERCKSKDKAWPRLDNFRSHLKRIHKFEDDQIECYVRRNNEEHQNRTTILTDGRMDPISEIPDDGHRLASLSEEPPNSTPLSEPVQWTSEKLLRLGHPEQLIDPSLEETDVQQTFVLHTQTHDVGSNQTRGLEQQDRKTSWQVQPQGKSGCLEDSPRQFEPETSGNTQPPVIKETKPSPKLTNSEEVAERGKATKRNQSSMLDVDLREAITAVWKDKMERIGGSPHRPRGPQNGHFPGLSNVAPVTGLVSLGDIHGVCLPSLSMTMANISNNCTASPAKEDSSSLLIEEVLEAIKKAGYIVKKDPKSSGAIGGDRPPGSSSVRKTENIVQCNLCPRFKGRPCELKKHMKRHERPYGCTFPKCKKAFGSKNDWKRHENSQHYQSEVWRCDEQGCSKVFHQVALFKTHLAEMHKLDDNDVVNTKIDAHRIGSNFQAHFWCGFCQQVINLDQKGVDAWTERFNHIDDHFMGRNGRQEQSILQWVHADGKDSEGVRLSPIEESCEESSSSSTPSSDSSPKSNSSNNEEAPEVKRPRETDGDEPAPKRVKYVKYEDVVDCCHCGMPNTRKLFNACQDCSHPWCDRCEGKLVEDFE